MRDLGPWDDFKTITNEPEWVVEKVCNEHPSMKRLLYYDSEGHLDEIRFENGRFKSFLPCPSVEELLELKEREERAKEKEIISHMKMQIEQTIRAAQEATHEAITSKKAELFDNARPETWFEPKADEEPTMLELFAVHAPKEIPPWFSAKLPEGVSSWDELLDRGLKEVHFQWPWFWAQEVLKRSPKK